MKRVKSFWTNLLFALFFIAFLGTSCHQEATFPDGTVIPEWFADTTKTDPISLGKRYYISDFGAIGDGLTMNTKAIQQAIDSVSSNGGGVIVVTPGVYKSGALFFKPNTHLHLEVGGVLKGSDNIEDYPIQPSRMEGQNLDYFPALINAYNVPGFSITGDGTIDGNGEKYWKAFWQRRKENPQCTNLEVSRPRLVFIWGCDDVRIENVKLLNSGFWTTHLYQCNRVKILGVHIFAPRKPIPAPSSDAIDLDVCSDVLINGCYMSVNDDAIAFKGGKGPWADKDPNNGPNTNIIIQNNTFGFCHAALTCGSESIHNRNILMRDCKMEDVARLIHLKMRPDMPQLYEYITLERISGTGANCIFIKPWTQFYDLKDRETPPPSVSENITFRYIKMKVKSFTNIGITENDHLKNFTFENMNIEAENPQIDFSVFEGLKMKNVLVNGELVKNK
ncbi:MAG: glycoside hydrolase family 28 protein [Draconibacterium sp.]